MSKYKLSVRVTWEAWEEIEVEAKNREDAISDATFYHRGIDVSNAEETDVEIESIECLDTDEEEPAEAVDSVPKEQIALPGCEHLVAGVVRR